MQRLQPPGKGLEAGALRGNDDDLTVHIDSLDKGLLREGVVWRARISTRSNTIQMVR